MKEGGCARAKLVTFLKPYINRLQALFIIHCRSLLVFPPSHLLESKMLWVDKYRPKTLDNLIVHDDVAQNLKKLVRFFFWSSLLYTQNHDLWCRVSISVGTGYWAGLPPFAVLRPTRIGQENPNHGHSQTDVRTQRWQGLSLLLHFFSFSFSFWSFWLLRKVCWVLCKTPPPSLTEGFVLYF